MRPFYLQERERTRPKDTSQVYSTRVPNSGDVRRDTLLDTLLTINIF